MLMRAMLRIAVALAVLAQLSSGARADEEKVPLDKLLKSVTSAVKKRFPNLDLKDASKEVTEDKKTVYEVTLMDGKMKIDVSVTPEGSIVMIEKQIDRKDLPKPVSAAI